MLSDDDMYAVLKCIDARNNLKVLKLTGCVNIIGVGLTPLSGSAVLKDIDLSLVGQHERIGDGPQISEHVVIPILDSIVEADEPSLEFLRLPKVWRQRQTGPKFSCITSPDEIEQVPARVREQDSLVNQFLVRFNLSLETRRHRCSQCSVFCQAPPDGNLELQGIHCNRFIQTRNRAYWETNSRMYGLQNFSCNLCQKFFCYECQHEDGPNGRYLAFCRKCEDCADCLQLEDCDHCLSTICSKWYHGRMSKWRLRCKIL